MLRLHHPDFIKAGSEIVIGKQAAHHLLNVMRTKINDSFILFNASGEFKALLISIDKKIATVKVQEKLVSDTESPCKITLFQAVTRRERMDYSIQKATELGVHCIQPVITEHCVVKLDEKKSRQRLKHWQGIAQHATEQSGRLVIPEIKPIMKWPVALENSPQDKKVLKLIFTLYAAKPLAMIDQNADCIHLALGPVGGFSENEVSLALSHDFHPIKLGPRVLRAETATTAALTAVQMLWGDLNLN